MLFKEIKEIEVVVQLVKLRATFKSNFDAYFLERCHDGWNTCTQQCTTQNTGKSALFPSVEYFEVLARVCPTGSVARVGMTAAGFPRCLFCWRLWSNGERLYRLVCQQISWPVACPQKGKTAESSFRRKKLLCSPSFRCTKGGFNLAVLYNTCSSVLISAERRVGIY